MILPTIASFERVTGDLDRIRLDVDVMPNRTGREKSVLYGKDIAAIMEHSCVRHFLLNGMNIRSTAPMREVEDSIYARRVFPAHFSRIVDRSSQDYMPHVHNSERFVSEEYGADTGFPVTMKYCMGFPSFNPDCEFTEIPVVSESTGYSGQYVHSGAQLLISQLNAWMNDMKLQHYSSVEFSYIFNDDEYVFYDEHGYYLRLYDYYSYFATPRGDGWRIIGGEGSRPMSVTYPTQHIAKAQMWMYVPGMTVYRYWRDEEGTSHDEGYSLGQFVFKICESTNGSLAIDQARMTSCIKNAITSSGHTFYTMENVGHGFDDRDTFRFRFNPTIVIVFEADNHTKWW